MRGEKQAESSPDGTIRYDTKESLTWTQKLSDQLNLARVARKKHEKEQTKTNNRQCPVQFSTGSRSVKVVRKE